MRHLLLLAALIVTPAFAQDLPDYLDDRSTAEAVIRSYYNAIDRKEYARAYSYYGTGGGPEFESFAAGYSDTASVAVSLGEVVGDGAAGSSYFTVPVALAVSRTDGSKVGYSGCYTLRLVQPANQIEPPFQGIHIETAKLAEVKKDDPAPATCS